MLTVREAGPGDLADVLRLLRQDVIREVEESPQVSAGHRAALEQITAEPHSTVLVGEVDRQIISTCQVFWLRHLIYDGGPVCQIESVRTAPSVRGRGYGRQLMEWVITEARRRGCARVQLTTNAARVEARCFYERLGFVESHIGMKLYLGQET